MPRKEVQIAAAHTPEVGSTKQSGVLRVAETAGEGYSGPEIGHGIASHHPPMNKRMRQAKLIKASKEFAAQSTMLGDVPERFDKDKYYRVQLTQTVLDHAGNCLRPADDVMVSGSFAEEIGEFISAASEV